LTENVVLLHYLFIAILCGKNVVSDQGLNLIRGKEIPKEFQLKASNFQVIRVIIKQGWAYLIKSALFKNQEVIL
jgi:hypothetical protein